MALSLQLKRLEEVVRATIPLATAMDVRVAPDGAGLTLTAPLSVNANPHGTLFGGSAAALAILAGWSLVKVRLLALGLEPTIVIQRTTMDFVAPAHDDLEARAEAPDEAPWERFLRTLRRRGRARLALHVTLWSERAQVASLTGWYVALADDAAG